MSIFDSFRAFVGLPRRNDDSSGKPQFKKPIIGEEEYDDDDEFDELNDYNFNQNRGNGFGFNMFTGDILEMHRFFEQQFDEIIRSFHDSNWFSPGFSGGMIDGPSRGMLETPTEDLQPDVNPRQKFLKPSYVQPSKGQLPVDSDIDDRVSSSRVLDLFPDKHEKVERGKIQQRQHNPPSTHFSFSSQVVKKKLLPNGGVEEERKIVREGKEEVTVSRQLGDKKHVLTTTKLLDGTTQINEEFINLSQDELTDFNKAWSSGSNPSNSIYGRIPESDSTLVDIIKRFF